MPMGFVMTVGGMHLVELSVKNLACVRGERPVFAGLSFRLHGGNALVLTGRNGAGKSSLLRVLAGLLPAAGGRIFWGSVDIAREREAHRTRVRFVGHADAVKPALSVAENLYPYAVLWGGRGIAAKRIGDALAQFDIPQLADTPARWLSAGQRRRVALARLLLAPAALWLLDEPRTALDADASGRLDQAVERHRAGGGMVIMALHEGARPPGALSLDLDSRRAAAC
jgi:heme exporter protein A